MRNKSKKDVVVTTYGKGRKINKISIIPFEDDYYSEANHNTVESAEAYCRSINSIESEGDTWIFAKIIRTNIPYYLHNFIPFKFADLILKLEDKALQKVLREIDNDILNQAIRNESEEVKLKIYRNLSKNASEILKNDLINIRAISLTVIKEAKERIISITIHLIECGEIISPYIADDELWTSNQDNN